MNQWPERVENRSYGNLETYRKAAYFLDQPGIIEDWGCGTGYAKQFFEHANYVGVDGTPGLGVGKIKDLREYVDSPANSILIRHVLEHNWEWKEILNNALRSPQVTKLCVVIFTPLLMSGPTKQIAWHEEIGVPDLSFNREELTSQFPAYRQEVVDNETIFYIFNAR